MSKAKRVGPVTFYDLPWGRSVKYRQTAVLVFKSPHPGLHVKWKQWKGTKFFK